MIIAENFYQPNFGPILIAQYQAAICYVGLGPNSQQGLDSWARKNLALPIKSGNTPLIREAQRQISEYFSGQRDHFELPLYLSGTPFQLQIWALMQLIPYGKTAAYSNLAEALRKPGAVRAVGGACGANPVPIIVPCHRVVAKNGLGGFTGGLQYKKFLLNLEGFELR